MRTVLFAAPLQGVLLISVFPVMTAVEPTAAQGNSGSNNRKGNNRGAEADFEAESAGTPFYLVHRYVTDVIGQCCQVS